MAHEVYEQIFDAEHSRKIYGEHGHLGLMGFRVVSHVPDHVCLVLPFQAALAEETEGGLADGALLTLLDTAGSLAVWSHNGVLRMHVTVDMRMDRQSSPPPGEDITARGECYAVQGRLAFTRASVTTAGGIPIATMLATYMFTDSE